MQKITGRVLQAPSLQYKSSDPRDQQQNKPVIVTPRTSEQNGHSVGNWTMRGKANFHVGKVLDRWGLLIIDPARPNYFPDQGQINQFLTDLQVWSLSSFEVSCQLLTNDMNQVSSVSSWLPLPTKAFLCRLGDLRWHRRPRCHSQKLLRYQVVVRWKGQNFV